MSDDISFDAIEEDDLDVLFEDLAYNGFDIIGVRKKFLEGESKEVNVSNVILCLTALARSGNNVSKLSKKVKNPKTGSKLMKRLKSIGVKKRAASSDDITLPRVGLAFLPAYLTLRKLKKDKLQNQTSSKLPVELKDVCFCGVPEIWKLSDYKSYYKEFSELIQQKPEDETDDDVDEEEERKSKKRKVTQKAKSSSLPEWVQVAQSGYKSDTKIHSIMKTAMSAKTITFAALVTSIEAVLATVSEEMEVDAVAEAGDEDE